VDVGPGAAINPVADTALEQQEIERRRNLVRNFLNDFWSGVYEKRASFAERLDRAEDYLNERLAANGEFLAIRRQYAGNARVAAPIEFTALGILPSSSTRFL